MLKNSKTEIVLPLNSKPFEDLGFSQTEAYIHVKDTWRRLYPKYQPNISKLGPDEVAPFLKNFFYIRNKRFFLRKNPYLGLL